MQVDLADLVEVIDGFETVISPQLTIRKTVDTVAATDLRIVLSPHEHQDHRWIPPAQVGEHLYWQSNKDTWQLLAQAPTLHCLTRVPVPAGRDHD